MCFSAEADLVAGAALVPVGVLALREVKQARELAFAALPLLFAGHQLVEAVVWRGAEGELPTSAGHAAALVYVVYAFAVLPVLVPLAVLGLEPRVGRRRVAPFVALGTVVAAYLGTAVLAHPLGVVVHPHALEYQTGVRNGGLWAVLYIAAVIGPSVLSGYRSIVAFGVVNLVGLSIVAIAYSEAFASLWCVQAALSSVLILLHMVRRRALPDSDRLLALYG